MTYQELRQFVKSGDVVGADSGTFFAKIVKKFTGEKFSHVAMFVWHGTGLWIYEFVEGTGYQCMPASQWFRLREGQTLYHGRAPLLVQAANTKWVIDRVSEFRVNKSKHYGILSLFTVFLSQVIKKKLPTYFKVCSTFVQYVWERAGVEFKQTADPGDIMRMASQVEKLTKITNIEIKD
jgi:hypothetical protein